MKLINGDCLLELPTIIKKLKTEFVIVTDPPFNIGYHYKTYSDNLESEAYYDMLAEVFSYGSFVVIHYPEEIYKISSRIGEVPEKVVSWVYNANTPKQHRDIAFFGVKPDFNKCGQPYKNPKDKRIIERIKQGKSAKLYDWWEVQQVKNVSKNKTAHPCQMPNEVMDRVIKILPENITIIDPFMGSGTTGVACKKAGKDFIGIEIDQTYFNIANNLINGL